VFAIDEQHCGGEDFEASEADGPSKTARDTHVVCPRFSAVECSVLGEHYKRSSGAGEMWGYRHARVKIRRTYSNTLVCKKAEFRM
jgi:hypothetical protein